MLKFKSDFNTDKYGCNEQTWLQCTVWLLLDLIRLTKDTQKTYVESPEAEDALKRLDLEESKQDPKSSFPGGSSRGRKMANQSFSQTLGMCSSLQNSRYYKPYQKASLLVATQSQKNEDSDHKSPIDASKGVEGAGLSQPLTQNMDTNQAGPCLAPLSNIRRGKGSKASRDLAKFFQSNEISRNVITVGRNGSVRFGPDGVFRATSAAIKEVKKRQQEKAQLERNDARKKLMKKLRERSRPLDSQVRSQTDSQPIMPLQEGEDILPPLQCLVLLDCDLASSLFCDLFGVNFPNIFAKSQVAHQAHIAEATIKILSESVACDTSVMSSVLLILLKICKEYPDIDAKAIERVGTKSLNFAKAILLLEELIICKGKQANDDPRKAGSSKQEATKEWISLKRLHEASDSTGSQNLMLDDSLLIEEDPETGEFIFSRKLNSEITNKAEVERLSQKYLKQLEESKEFGMYTQELADEIKFSYYEGKSELLEWEAVCKDLEPHLSKDNLDASVAKTLIDSCIRVPEYSDKLQVSIERWLQDKHTKNYLERDHSYQLALLCIQREDYMRGFYYINRDIKALSFGVPSHAQHHMIQKLTKNFECRQFLELITKVGLCDHHKLAAEILASVQGWIQRPYSPVYDPLSFLDDVVTSRICYLDSYEAKIDGFSDKLASDPELSEIRSRIYLQAAIGARDMALYDSSEKYLSKAVKACEDLHYCTPLIVDLKIKQYKKKYLNEDYYKISKDCAKLAQVINRQRPDDTNSVESSRKGIQQMLMLADVYQMGMELFIHNVKEGFLNEDQDLKYKEAMLNTLETYNSILQEKEFPVDNHLLTEANMKLALLADSLLSSEHQIVADTIKSNNIDNCYLALTIVKCGFAALNREAPSSSSLIPRILQVLSLYPKHCKDEFKEGSKNTPSWKFLGWKSQILALINEPIVSDIISKTVVNLFKNYPQALFYAFKVVESDLLLKLVSVDESKLYKALQRHCQSANSALNCFVESLDCLVEPEFRWKYWIDLIKEAMGRGDPDSRSKAAHFAKLMICNIATEEHNFVGAKIGQINRDFAKKYAKKIIRAFGEDGSKLLGYTYNDFADSINSTYEEINRRFDSIESGLNKLSNFSEWLAYSYSYFDYKQYIEIPGQYEQDEEPYLENHVKIAGFNRNVLTLGSMRKPKRLTINGSNEKEYNLLVKGGEDLRLDQRVQQVFKIMNKCLSDNPNCHNRNLKICTIQVVPITNRAGVIEWINNTTPLKAMIESQMDEGISISNCRATAAMRKFFNKIAPDESIHEQHIAALECKREVVVQNYKNVVSKLGRYLLREGLKSKCSTPEIFLFRRANFIRSYASFCIGSYILGIGDRHLENFLVSLNSGRVYGIDFGIAFDSGVQLGVPELAPFRLTPQISELIKPYHLHGDMRHALSALRNNQNLILDTCEIFIKEPLLEWVKEAQSQNFEVDKYKEEELGKAKDTKEKIEWYPQLKINRMKEKLEGRNSAKIIMKELSNSSHAKKEYFQQIKLALVGVKGEYRYEILKSKKRFLDVDEQVNFLIHHAEDPDILGRLWIGWAPYV